MVESYRINARLNLTSNAIPELALIGQKFKAFDAVIKQSTKEVKAFDAALSSLGSSRRIGGLVTSLERLGRVHLGNLSGLAGLIHLSHLGSINTSGISKVAASMSKLGAANLGGLSGHLQALITPLTTIHNLQQGIATAAHSTATAWNQMAGHIRAAAAAMRGMPPPRVPSMGSPGRPPSVTNRSSGNGTQTFQDGAVGASVAAGYLEQGLAGVYHGGMDAGEALAKLSLAGFTAAEVAEANNKAFEVQKGVKGSTVGGNLEIMKDVFSIMQDAKEAIASTSEMAKLGVVLGKVGKGDQINELFAAIRAGELAGALNKPGSETIDPELLTKFLHGLSSTVVKTGGRVTPSDYVALFQMSGIAGARMSEEARFATIPAVMMALKASKAGNALQSFQQSEIGHLASGYGPAQAKIGLFEMSDLEKVGKGGATHIRTGALKGFEEFQTNLPHWIWNTLMPLLAKAVNPKGKLNPEAETNAMLIKLYDLFPRNTITRLVEDIIRNKPLIQKDEASIQADLKSAPNYNDRLDKMDPKLHESATFAAWDALNKAIGQATSTQSMNVLDNLTGSLNKLSDWARANPKDAAFYTDLALGLGAVTTAIAAMGVAMMVITPAAAALTAAVGGAAALGALVAHYFPANHPPGEQSKADILLDALHMKPAGPPKIDWRTGNVDFGLGGYSIPSAAPPAPANNNLPGSSAANPSYNIQLNQPSARDIAHGATDFMGRHLSGPPASQTGTDGRSVPNFSYMPLPQ